MVSSSVDGRALGASVWSVGHISDLSVDQYPPPITIRLMEPGAEAALAAEGLQLEAGVFVERARRVVQGDVTATQAFTDGLVRIQDEGSQLIGELAGRGTAILDCCAAPGGKTAILAERNPQLGDPCLR